MYNQSWDQTLEKENYVINVINAFFSKLQNTKDWDEWAPYLIKLGASLVKLEKKRNKFTLGIILPCLEFSPALVGVGYIIGKLRYKQESNLNEYERIKKIPIDTPVQFILGDLVYKGISKGLKTREELGYGYPVKYGFQVEIYSRKKIKIDKKIHTIPPNSFHSIKQLKIKNDDNISDTKKADNVLDGISYSRKSRYVNKIIHEIFPKEEIMNMLFNKTLCCEFFITKKYFEKEVLMKFREFYPGNLNDLLMVDDFGSNKPSIKSRIFTERKNKDLSERPHLSIFCGSLNYNKHKPFSSENKVVLIGASENSLQKANAISDINKSYSHRDQSQEFNYNLLPKNYWELEMMGFYSQPHE